MHSLRQTGPPKLLNASEKSQAIFKWRGGGQGAERQRWRRQFVALHPRVWSHHSLSLCFHWTGHFQDRIQHSYARHVRHGTCSVQPQSHMFYLQSGEKVVVRGIAEGELLAGAFLRLRNICSRGQPSNLCDQHGVNLCDGVHDVFVANIGDLAFSFSPDLSTSSISVSTTSMHLSCGESA